MFKDYGRGPAAVKVFFERVQNWVPISADSRRTREHAAAPPLREAGEESAYSDPENQPRRRHIEDAVADGWGAAGEPLGEDAGSHRLRGERDWVDVRLLVPGVSDIPALRPLMCSASRTPSPKPGSAVGCPREWATFEPGAACDILI
jgi:hypothetical protein